MYTVTVSVRGQIAIPVEARKKLGIKEGDTLTIQIEEGGKLILKTNRREEIPKGIVVQTAGILSDMEISGKEFIENLRKDSGRRLDNLENNS
jgi:AbrB family looped-hinge helix DNA binding protein